jgi:putative SOS response-associated peptidase YedK
MSVFCAKITSMCGRAYKTYTDEELFLRYLNKRRVKLPSFKPNYNIAPTQDVLVLRNVDGDKQFDLFHWGLIPVWEKEFKTKLSTINAKSETVFESKLYKGPVTKHRCIVPLSGFIEWKREGESKRPFAIHLKDEPIMSVAGIWSTWGSEETQRHSFSILTTSANEFMEKIHDRMPVILSPKDEDAYLDPTQKPESIAKLLKPCPKSWLTAHEISTLINSPRNNRPEVLEPI